jgi:hypothetical protein
MNVNNVQEKERKKYNVYKYQRLFEQCREEKYLSSVLVCWLLTLFGLIALMMCAKRLILYVSVFKNYSNEYGVTKLNVSQLENISYIKNYSSV